MSSRRMTLIKPFFREPNSFYKFLACLVSLLFVVLVLKGVHGSSIGIWSDFLMDSGSSPVLIGKNRAIRSDEWLALTPFYISQLMADPAMPVQNSKTKYFPQNMVIGLFAPVKNLVVLLKPQVWGYLTNNVNFGLSWFWNFKGVFLFFSLICWFRLTLGTKITVPNIIFPFVITFSPFIQWWFSTTFIDILSYTLLIGCILILWHKKEINSLLRSVAGGSCVGYLAACNLATLTPQFLVPLFWLILLFVVLEIYLKSKYSAFSKIDACFLLVALSTAGIASFYYCDLIKDEISIILKTAYPGARSSINNKFLFSEFFRGSFSWKLPKTPPPFLNECEASDFLSFLPLVYLWLIFDMLKVRRHGQNRLLIPTCFFYINLLLVHQFVGLPGAVSKFTGFSLVPDYRLKWVINFLCILLLPALSHFSSLDYKARKTLMVLSSLTAFLAVLWEGRSWAGYLTGPEILLSALILPFLYLGVMLRKTMTLCLVLLPLTFFSGISINPISMGTGSLLTSDLSRKVQEIRKEDPSGKWLGVDSNLIAQFLNANGVMVIGGFNWVPMLKMWEKIDPQKSNWDFYNRYGYSSFHSTLQGDFYLPSADYFQVRLTDQVIKVFNPKYILSPSPYITLSKTAPMEPIFKAENGWTIFRVKNGKVFSRAERSRE